MHGLAVARLRVEPGRADPHHAADVFETRDDRVRNGEAVTRVHRAVELLEGRRAERLGIDVERVFSASPVSRSVSRIRPTDQSTSSMAFVISDLLGLANAFDTCQRSMHHRVRQVEEKGTLVRLARMNANRLLGISLRQRLLVRRDTQSTSSSRNNGTWFRTLCPAST